VARLLPLGIAVGEVVDLAAALDGELARARGTVVSVDTPEGPLRMVANPIRFADAPGEYRLPPRLHEHTDEVVRRDASDQAS
jgi:crotonobetainyl-CoA:carnitine CoA-transferase CaiB-like acyl-CoA transferase